MRNLSLNYWLKTAYICLFLSLYTPIYAQSILSLDSCYALAQRNYPLIKQLQLIEQSKAYAVKNIAMGYLPQLSVGGQATYQSDVTKLPFQLPGMALGALSKDQYKVYAEVSQPLTDVFTLGNQQQLIEAMSTAEQQKVEVDIYKIKERIHQLFYGILLLEAQRQQTEFFKKDIEANRSKTMAAHLNGIALKSQVEIWQAELIKVNQRLTEIQTSRQGYIGMLSLFIHQPIPDSCQLIAPTSFNSSRTLVRPELQLFDTQKQIQEKQSQVIGTKIIPRAALFLQTGYGRPTLNMLNDAFDFYYIGGIKVNWNLSSLYTLGKERKITSLNQDIIEAQKQTFILQITSQLTQQQAEINKLEELIRSDQELISLRESILKTAQSQLENGIITTTEYIQHINAEDLAKQTLLLHLTQLGMAQSLQQLTLGH